ncbi:MAG: transporter substrate-binding domain-containing protein, partial [Cycloclasticus sp.]|nr:transporter substrate-binding domain-containing protein [Cycloclasticus sp.]
DKVIIDNAYFKEEIVAVRKSTSAAIPLSKLFADYGIGVELDTLSDFYLLGAMGGRFRANVNHFPTVELAVQGLQEGVVKSVVAPRSQIEGYLKEASNEYVFTKVVMPASYQSTWVVGMAVKEGREKLVLKLANALNQIKESGEFARLLKKYHISNAAE